MAAQGDDGIDPWDSPEPSRALQATAEAGFATRLDDPEAPEQMLRREDGIAHAVGIDGKILWQGY